MGYRVDEEVDEDMDKDSTEMGGVYAMASTRVSSSGRKGQGGRGVVGMILKRAR